MPDLWTQKIPDEVMKLLLALIARTEAKPAAAAAPVEIKEPAIETPVDPQSAPAAVLALTAIKANYVKLREESLKHTYEMFK